MKNLLFLAVFSALPMFSCENEDDQFNLEITDSSPREKDDEVLMEIYQEILNMSSEYDCSNAEEWKFSALGAKACGGPASYIAYSIHINEDTFLEKIQHYTRLQREYNKKWGVISDCAVLAPPNGIECMDGKPKLVYN